MLEMRKLGQSQMSVSTISLGCWAFGGGDYWGAQAQKDVDTVVSRALDMGINLFDTAEAYNDGASETALAAALRGKRDRALILTKLNPNNDVDKLEERFEACLRRLETDYVDILMVHWPSGDRAVTEETFRVFTKLRQQGKVREIGVSNFGVTQMKEALALGVRPVVNELAYNLVSRAIEKEIIPPCLENGIGIITYSTLQQGVLTGKYRNPEEIPPGPAHSRHFADVRGKGTSRHGEEGAEEEIFALLDRMREMESRLGLTMSELAIAWCLRQKGIASVIVGCRNLEQLSANLKAADVVLDDHTNRLLLEYSQPVLDKLGDSADYYQNRNSGRTR